MLYGNSFSECNCIDLFAKHFDGRGLLLAGYREFLLHLVGKSPMHQMELPRETTVVSCNPRPHVTGQIPDALSCIDEKCKTGLQQSEPRVRIWDRNCV